MHTLGPHPDLLNQKLWGGPRCLGSSGLPRGLPHDWEPLRRTGPFPDLAAVFFTLPEASHPLKGLHRRF